MQNLKYNLMRGDCLKLLKEIESDLVDAIVTDPPYQYLNTKRKNCEFDKPYNEEVYIEEVKRIVLNTFMGSGSTGVACLNTNRRFIGMELNEVYFATAQKRMTEASIKVI